MKPGLGLIILLSGCTTVTPRVTTAPQYGSPTTALSVGDYSAGCLVGGVELSVSGLGYRILFPDLKRNFAHPELLQFLADLFTAVSLPLQIGIGDLSFPRGGPMPTGHASHQTGLDVDISYRPARDVPAGKTYRTVLDPARRSVDHNLWWAPVDGLLKAAANDRRVDRVFVNPAVKRDLCVRLGGHGVASAWLAKVRPWWGHEGHFHVRLKCPAASRDCVAPAEVLLATEGCGAELDWWSTAEATLQTEARLTGPRAQAAVPPACREMLGAGLSVR